MTQRAPTSGKACARQGASPQENVQIATQLSRPRARDRHWRDMLLAEQLVGEARERRASRMGQRERTVDGASALLFGAVALATAPTPPADRPLDPVLIGALV